MQLVVDASVALKWFFREREGEGNIDAALAVLDRLDQGHLRLVQPPHFLAEMAAVLIREKPDAAYDDLRDLQALDWATLEDDSVYELAMQLAATYQQHVFDMLYHAAALQLPETHLLTADRRYYDKAAAAGCIQLLGASRPW